VRVAIAAFYHETNVFALEQNDSLDMDVKAGEELFTRRDATGVFIQGMLDGFKGSGVELVPTVGFHFRHNGLIHAHVFEHCRDMIVQRLKEAMPLDAVLFALHGASVVEPPYTDAEGALLVAAREALGPDVPFVATYDFHAVMSQREVDQLAAAFPHDTNPHIDAYDRGLEAALCVRRMLRGEIKPVTRWLKVPIIGPNIGQSTWAHIPEEQERLPLYQLGKLREEMERRPGVINAAILGGYGYADTPDTSMSVLVTTDGDPALAEQLCRELAQAVWDKREEIRTVRPIYDVDEGVKKAMAATEWPVVLVDLGDDPGSACPADSPYVLEALLRNGAEDAVVVIRDPEAVQAGLAAGVGGRFEMAVGAKIDSRFYKPVPIAGRVKLIDDGEYTITGPTHGGFGLHLTRDQFLRRNVGTRVVVRLPGRIDVIFAQHWYGGLGKDRDFFKSAGIVLEEKKIIVVKSNQAHRASFDTIAKANIELNTPGVSTPDYTRLPFQHIRRPLYPIDRDFDWSP